MMYQGLECTWPIAVGFFMRGRIGGMAAPLINTDHKYPTCRVINRAIDLGGRSGAELLGDLAQAGIELNESAVRLLESTKFKASGIRSGLVTVELAVGDLGLSHGGTYPEVFRKAMDIGL